MDATKKVGRTTMFKFTTACVQAATCVIIMATTAYAEQIKLTAASSHPPFLPWVAKTPFVSVMFLITTIIILFPNLASITFR